MDLPKGVVKGTVLESQGGKPIPGAAVELFSQVDSGSNHRTETKTSGAFSIEVGIGDYTVAVSKEGYVKTFVPLVVAPGETMIELKLDVIGSRWFRHGGNPILDVGNGGSWENLLVKVPWVVRDGDVYRMWYLGGDGMVAPKIGYATSLDGLAWTKSQSNPVLDRGGAGDWDENSLESPAVIIIRGEDTTQSSTGSLPATYTMWYTARDSSMIPRIGLAQSHDGVNWTKAGKSLGGIDLTGVVNPVVDVGKNGDFDDDGAGQPSVSYDSSSGVYRMWYVGYNGDSRRIGYALSSDGISWDKRGEVNFDSSVAGARLLYPAVVSDGSLYRMWYMADDKLSYAVSGDGLDWTVHNMLMSGVKGAWEDKGMDDFSVLREDAQYKMWYSGSDGQVYRVGYATSP